MYKSIFFKPLKYSQIYLWTTFLLFALSSKALNLENPLLLFSYISIAFTCIYFGYHLGIRQERRTLYCIKEPSLKLVKFLIVASAFYYFSYGAVYLSEYGASGISNILSIILNPGEAYSAKFEIYEMQKSQNRTNSLARVVVLLGALQGFLIPLLVIFWEKISLKLKILGIISIIVYCSFFLFIGTMKGLGDILIHFALGYMVKTSRTKLQFSGEKRKPKSLKTKLMAITLAFGFIVYMSTSMQSRVSTLGNAMEINPAILENVVTTIFGDEAGVGVIIMLSYPSAGYLGFDKNLSTPFEWSYGLGSMRALNGYKNQYIGGEDYYQKSYPARTEARTGYPALMLWATIFPWLASDLTYFGALIVMIIIGWFIARLWCEAVMYARPLSLALLSSMFILIMYIPANNQIFQSRNSFIGFFVLLAFYIITDRGRKKNVWKKS
jgi:hypothetical protein